MFTRILWKTLSKTFCLLAGVTICAGTPWLARAGPALYNASVHIRMWERAVPYGALGSGAVLANSPSGDPVSLVGTSPAEFTLPGGQITLMTSLVDFSPPFTTLDFRQTYFSGQNGTGSFLKGGGLGSSVFGPVSSIPAGQFGVSFSGGPDRFGGVMRLLGQLDWRGETANCPFCYYHTVIPLGPIGGPFAGTATATAYVGGTASAPTWVTATVWGFPWDTGTVRGVASLLGTTSATATSVMGADLRTPSGLGTLQLVTPFVVRVISSPPSCGGCENRYYYAGIAGADIRFVPEPSASAVLATGLGTLALLYRRSKRRRP